MNKFLLAIIATALSLFSFAQNAKRVESKITDVTVFLSGAQVTHQSSVNLKPGENVFYLSDLTAYMDPNSVTVEGNPNFTILSVRHQVNYLVDASRNPRIKAIQDSLEDLQFQAKERQSLAVVFYEEKAMIQANRSVKGSDANLLSEDLAEMADFFRARMKEIEYKLLEINQQEKEINKQIAALQTQLNALNARISSNPSEIMITVNADKETKTNVRVSYVAQLAGWTPVYDLRAEDINSNIAFSYRARVYQSTGNDWNDVNLTISSGNPTVGGQMPTLNPWYINIYEPIVYKSEDRKRNDAYSQAPAVMYEKEADMGFLGNGSVAAESKFNSSSYVAAVQNTVSTEFKIGIPYDIPSDNQPYDVIMQDESLPAKYSYFAAPKLDNDAFLRAQLVDWMQYSLLPGESNIYFKGTFVGKGYIDPAQANDTLNISMGRDKAIQIKRDQIKEFCKTSTFGGKQKTTKAYEISVTNTKKQAVEMVIEDQLPISQNGDIEVETEELSGGSYDAQTGKVTWKVTLQPGETLKKQLRFNVKYPKKKLVGGL